MEGSLKDNDAYIWREHCSEYGKFDGEVYNVLGTFVHLKIQSKCSVIYCSIISGTAASQANTAAPQSSVRRNFSTTSTLSFA